MLLRTIKKKKGSDRRSNKSKMAERFTAEQVLELLSNDFDASKGEESDFGNDELYSYLPRSCTDGLDLPEAGISQSQDDS